MGEKGNGMRIIGLHAENFKRLVAVDLQPNGENLILGGMNESGKSSVLDAIWVALGGSDAAKNLNITRPIREGAESAMVSLNLGDLIVTRNWTSNEKSYLKVTTADGASYNSPQGMLDKLMGRLFDPFEFSRLKPADQRELLLGLVDIGIDLDEWAAQRKSIFDQRTLVNRDLDRAKRTVESMPLIDAPAEELSSAQVFEEMEKAQAVKDANDEKRRELDRCLRNARECRAAIQNQECRVESLKAQLEAAEANLAEGRKEMSQLSAEHTALIAETEALIDPDMTAYKQRVAEVETINSQVRDRKRREEMIAQRDSFKASADKLTADLVAMDKQKADALQAAKFPVEGLSIDETGVTFGGIPFGQCSSEERIRVGMAIAMAMSPKLRVIRIAEGSLLDDKAFGVITEMAAQGGFQLLVEVVGQPGEGGVIIEDGAVMVAEPETAEVVA